MKILVEPSNNIYAELGNNTYDFKDLLSELIDNSIASRVSGSTLNVKIEIEVDEAMNPIKFIVQDDAAGINEHLLGRAISPASIQTHGSLNEHGLGMKQAIAALGKLEYLMTKTADRDHGIRVSEFKFGEIDGDEVEFDRNRGTTISVVNLKPIVVTNASTYTRTIIPYLGARYRRFLRPDKASLSLEIEILDSKTRESYYIWDAKEVKPIYFHPGTRENRPVFNKYPLQGDGWKAELTFGYAPKDDSEYEELGLDVPNKFHPYRVALGTQGLDIILHERVILFHQLSEIELISQRHPDYNAIRGEIVLITGFSTAITKNSMIQDRPFRECVGSVKDILNGEKAGPGGRKERYLQHKSYPEELPERLLRDRLVEWLTNNPLQKKAHVDKEYAVEGVEGCIDILADGEAWELKRDQASALDVYQLFMYMDIGNVEKGYLIAKSFSPGADIAARVVSEKHHKIITLAPREQFPINHPPNAQEREDYY